MLGTFALTLLQIPLLFNQAFQYERLGVLYSRQFLDGQPPFPFDDSPKLILDRIIVCGIA